jgi:hypothetical protein
MAASARQCPNSVLALTVFSKSSPVCLATPPSANDLEASPSPRLKTAAANLRVDLVTREVAEAFDECGIPHLLLKGPSVACWLYGPGERAYVDSDLLVAPERYGDASQVLLSLGFRPPPDGGWATESADGSWLRGSGEPAVDFHRRIWGPRAQPRRVWDDAYAEKVFVCVLGRDIPTLGITARALHVLMHAVQHGGRSEQALEDLRRVVRSSEVDWVKVSGLAVSWDATSAFFAGLSLIRDDAAALGLAVPSLPDDLEVQARLHELPALAHHIAKVRARNGLLPQLATALRRLFPGAAYMRKRYATRGVVSLSLAYGRRVIELFRQARTVVPYMISRRPRR